MEAFSGYIIPVMIALIILFGFFKKVPCFDCFLEGAKQGLISTYKIAPSLIGLIVAVTMLKASGALDMLVRMIEPAAAFLGFPAEVMPLALLRPVSGSGATAILNTLLKDYGPDSFIGRCASVMAGSTETTFYAIAVYYGAVGVKKIRHTVPAALCADFAGMVMAVLSVRLFYP